MKPMWRRICWGIAPPRLPKTAARWRPLENWLALAKAGKAGELYLAFGGILYPPDVFESLRDAFLQAAKTVTPRELERFVLLAEAVRGFDASAALGHVSCPTLVVGSRDDLVFGADAAAEIAAGIPGAGLHLYDGCGHALYDTASGRSGWRWFVRCHGRRCGSRFLRLATPRFFAC